MIAKWLMTEPSIFIMDEPTRGIDVGAKYEIYSIIDRLAADGGGVLFISSELEELLAMCDRILVMSRGEIVGEFARSEFDREAHPRRRLPRAGGRGMNGLAARPADRPSPAHTRRRSSSSWSSSISASAPPTSSAPRTSLNIVKQASFIGVIAVGMTFVLLTAGIDLSVGSNMYVSAMTVGYLLQVPGLQGGFGVFAGLVVGLATGAVFGAVNAFCIVFLRDHALPRDARHDGRRPRPRHRDNRVLRHRLSRRLHRLRCCVGRWASRFPIIIFALVVAVAHVVLTRTAFGRQLYAVGNDVEAARKAGIDVRRIVFSVYVISGLCAALGGVTLIALVGRLNQTFGVGKEFDVITAAVLGGTSLFGGVGTALRRGRRLGPRPDGPGRNGLREGQSLPAADGARRDHLSCCILRQLARGTASPPQTAPHPRRGDRNRNSTGNARLEVSESVASKFFAVTGGKRFPTFRVKPDNDRPGRKTCR